MVLAKMSNETSVFIIKENDRNMGYGEGGVTVLDFPIMQFLINVYL